MVKMSKVQMVRALVNQRLTAAAEEIFGLFERTIAEYEEELCRSKEKNRRQQKLLDAVLKPEVRLRREDIQQLLVVKEEVPPEQQEWSPSLDQEDPPEPPHIKEEQEELWTSQEGEQLQGLEEADITKFLFTPVPVKSEDDEEKPQSSKLHQRQTEQMETRADVTCNTGDKPFSCSECGKVFSRMSHMKEHMTTHIVKSFICSICGKGFHQKGQLTKHMIVHTGERAFGCTDCDKRFKRRCHLTDHMLIHRGVKPFCCSFCGKRYNFKRYLRAHVAGHREEKRFRCRVCDQRFAWKQELRRHKLVCPQSSQLQQTEEIRGRAGSQQLN